MTVVSAVNNIELIISIIGLICLFYGPWQKFVVEVLRQNIFRLRDSLFLGAADGCISFSSSEYRAVRDRLNAMIRYAHTATWWHLLAFAVAGPKRIAVFDIDGICARVENREFARKMKRAYQRAIYYTMMTMVARSFFLIVMNMILLPFVLVAILLDVMGLKRFVAIFGRAIDRDVEIEQGSRRLITA